MTASGRKHLLISCGSISTEGRLSSVDGGGRPQAISVEEGGIAIKDSTLSVQQKQRSGDGGLGGR